jgi:hypothetical protein
MSPMQQSTSQLGHCEEYWVVMRIILAPRRRCVSVIPNCRTQTKLSQRWIISFLTYWWTGARLRRDSPVVWYRCGTSHRSVDLSLVVSCCRQHHEHHFRTPAMSIHQRLHQANLGTEPSIVTGSRQPSNRSSTTSETPRLNHLAYVVCTNSDCLVDSSAESLVSLDKWSLVLPTLSPVHICQQCFRLKYQNKHYMQYSITAECNVVVLFKLNNHKTIDEAIS